MFLSFDWFLNAIHNDSKNKKLLKCLDEKFTELFKDL